MFASKTLLEHVARGVLGFGAISAAVLIGSHLGAVRIVAALVLASVALVVLRGCPMCWTIGLLDTLIDKPFRSKPKRLVH